MQEGKNCQTIIFLRIIQAQETPSEHCPAYATENVPKALIDNKYKFEYLDSSLSYTDPYIQYSYVLSVD